MFDQNSIISHYSWTNFPKLEAWGPLDISSVLSQFLAKLNIYLSLNLLTATPFIAPFNCIITLTLSHYTYIYTHTYIHLQQNQNYQSPTFIYMEIEIGESTSGGGGAAGEAFLAWEDLTAVLPNFGNGPTKRLINGLTGYALPGRIMAVMGPSGSGKSTFLDSLAGLSLPLSLACLISVTVLHHPLCTLKNRK